MPQIEVAFDIDANGILNVHAKDRGTGKEQKITITSSSGLDKTEVEKAVKEADSHRSEDQKRREGVEAKNQLDSIVYATEKLIQENGDKVPASEKAAVESAIADAKKVLETQPADTEAMKKATQDVQKASYKIAEALYKTAPAEGAAAGMEPGAGGAPASSSAKADDVIDAEVVEEKK
jgi:molecular chaperone DnaK